MSAFCLYIYFLLSKPLKTVDCKYDERLMNWRAEEIDNLKNSKINLRYLGNHLSDFVKVKQALVRLVILIFFY